MRTVEAAPATGLTTHFHSRNVFPFSVASSLTMLQAMPAPAALDSGSLPTPDLYGFQPYRSVRIIVTRNDPIVPLAVVLERRLNELLAMKSGWDAGRGLELSPHVVKVALPMIFGVVEGRGLAPQVFPLSDGGLQFEWHVNASSIEVEVDADGSAFAVAESQSRGIVVEEEVDDSTLVRLREFLAENTTA